MRSRMASATVVCLDGIVPVSSGSCDVTMIDLRPCRSSMISVRCARSLASRGTRKRSSRIRVAFFRVSSVPPRLSLCFGYFQSAHQFGGVCVHDTHAGLAGLVSQSCGQVAFARAGTAGDEQVVSFADKIQRGKTFHLVAVQATRQRVVDLRHRCVVVSEVRAFYKAFDVSGHPVVPFPGEQPVQEAVRCHCLGEGRLEAFGERGGHSVKAHTVHEIQRDGVAVFLRVTGEVLSFVSIFTLSF